MNLSGIKGKVALKQRKMKEINEKFYVVKKG